MSVIVDREECKAYKKKKEIIEGYILAIISNLYH